MRQDEGAQGGYPVEDDLNVHKLEHRTRDDGVRAGEDALLLRMGLVAPDAPGQPKYVGRAQAEHIGLHGGDELIEQRGEGSAQAHDHKKAQQHANVEGEGTLEAVFRRVGHRHNVVRPRRNSREQHIGTKSRPVHLQGLLKLANY